MSNDQSNQGASRATILGALRRVLDLAPVGYITSHMEEILTLPPEIARIDAVTFRGQTTNAGIMAAGGQPGNIQLQSDYESELFAIIGTCSEPNDAGAGIICGSFLEFNIREQGRNFNMFTNDQPMSNFIGLGGSIGQVEYPRGAYVFRKHSDVTVRFAPLAGLVAPTSTAKEWTITLLLNLARES